MSFHKPILAPDFLSKKPPPNYIAGLGRGATGFTTRSDIGPAREQTADPMQAARDMMEQQQKEQKKDDNDEERYQDPDTETGLFNTAPYEADDEEADRIYEQVDAAMDERRRARREAREKEELDKYRKERPKIQAQFADLKRGLAAVSNDEWASLPEVGDLVRNASGSSGRKKQKFDRFTPAPDIILNPGAGFGSTVSASSGFATSIDPKLTGGVSTPFVAGGVSSVVPGDQTVDFGQFGEGRKRVLANKIDQKSLDSVSGSSTVDPKNYLDGLNSIITKTDAEISDIKKARQLLRSVILTNPKHAPGWIAAARLEEVAQKIVAARELAAKGCLECPTSEDIWLESARLNTVENAKVILATGVRNIPTSVKIWLRAMSLETDPKAQKRVLRRALEFIPNSVKIWKAAVSLEEDPEDARILLSRAVECVPLSTELWLALARLESYENAKRVLNKARAAIPTSHEIWITAAKLEEQQGSQSSRVDILIKNAVSALAAKGSTLDRDSWIKEAEACEQEGFVATAQAIIKATIAIDVDDEDREATWLEDAESSISHGAIATARAIYAFALQEFPEEDGIWRKAAFLEKSHGTRESLQEILQRAVKYCPQAEVLWLMGAKEKWLGGDLAGARGILESAFEANPNSEQIWLAAIKLEVETFEYGTAQLLLQKARTKADTDRVWMKSVILERQLGNLDKAMQLLDEALKKFPSFGKLWMIKAQIEEMQNQVPTARDTLAKAVKAVPKGSSAAITLWILSSRLEEKSGNLTKARALLEKARLLNPKVPDLWCEAIRVESRAGNQSIAESLISKSLQECPMSGLLWSEAILTESRPQRKARSKDALMKCENDSLVLVTVARLFWSERKPEKARNWFSRAVKVNPDLGDSWAWWLKFESVQEGGNEERVADVIKKCVAADPHHGEKWQACVKDLKNTGKSVEEVLKIVASSLPVTV
ncbi:UNVERIFIED_CONTAM: hypothetical protein HDU68_012692 [Siphonaria sp. JEL0065]|nr:hypothetical protein HDU68_012692 [Siphonaria sp. JEL0065]